MEDDIEKLRASLSGRELAWLEKVWAGAQADALKDAAQDLRHSSASTTKRDLKAKYMWCARWLDKRALEVRGV